MSESGDTGILVGESDRNVLVGNTTRLLSDSGITLNAADDGVVRGNDLRGSPGGLQIDGSNRNIVEADVASASTGIGIQLGGGSFGDALVANTAGDNGITVAEGGHTLTASIARGNSGRGIHATGEVVDGLGNAATGNGQAGQCVGVRCTADAEPPETTIDDGPDAVTNDATEVIGFSGRDDTVPAAGLRFECRLLGGGVDDPLFARARAP